MDKINHCINHNRFIPIDSEELSALELIGKNIEKTNELVEQTNALKESNNKKVSYDDMKNIYKHNNSDFVGSWHGIEKPTFSDPGIASVVDKIDNTIGYISIKNFGAKGDYITDDTEALIKANEYCTINNKILKIPTGVYRLTKSIDKSCSWIGEGQTNIGVFPLFDEKTKLQNGQKQSLNGSVLIFDGVMDKVYRTQRIDDFSEGTYCIKESQGIGYDMKDITLILNVDTIKDGKWTTKLNDNTSLSDYGYVVDDSFRGIHENFNIFGYFRKSGLLVMGIETENYLGDPDYNSFKSCTFMGNIGVSILGSDKDDKYQGGLSGTRFIDCMIYSNDHHSRDKLQDSWGKACLYIDGYTSATSTKINGHYFSQCTIRSYCNNPIILGMATNVSFFQTVFETPKYSTPNSMKTKFLANEYTNDIIFNGCRFSDGASINENEFCGVIKKLIIIGEPFDDISISSLGKLVRLGNENGKQFVQFTDDISSKVKGQRIMSEGNNFILCNDNVEVFRLSDTGLIHSLGVKNGGTKQIINKTITIGSYSYYGIDANGETELTTIDGGKVGQLLTLRTVFNSKPFTIKHQTGNIRCGGDKVIDNSFDRITLEYDGTYWVCINYNSNN